MFKRNIYHGPVFIINGVFARSIINSLKARNTPLRYNIIFSTIRYGIAILVEHCYFKKWLLIIGMACGVFKKNSILVCKVFIGWGYFKCLRKNSGSIIHF